MQSRRAPAARLRATVLSSRRRRRRRRRRAPGPGAVRRERPRPDSGRPPLPRAPRRASAPAPACPLGLPLDGAPRIAASRSVAAGSSSGVSALRRHGYRDGKTPSSRARSFLMWWRSLGASKHAGQFSFITGSPAA